MTLAKKHVTTSMGDIAYLEAGDPSSPPLLLVHGIPTSSYLWRDVLRLLAPSFRCYAPDLMGLGDSRVDPDADCFHMEAQAEMLGEVMTALGHERFGLVCHDQGGAAAQLLVARSPERVTAWVITNCVCYDNWPVPAVRRLQALARLPGVSRALARLGAFHLMETKTPLSAFRRGVYRPRRLTDETINEYLRPLRESRQSRARFFRFLLAGSPIYSLRAVKGMRRFQNPTLVLWGADDHYLSPSWGKKLCEEIPGARRMELIPFCGHFWQEERPAEFTSHMLTFFKENIPSGEEN